MSNEETIVSDVSETQLLTAEYKDGHLQIVEMASDKAESILPDLPDDSHKYMMQVMDPNKGLMQLDLLNLTLVRCEDGEESYRLVTNGESGLGELSDDATVTCVLQSSDGEDVDNQGSYVMVEGSSGLMLVRSTTDDTRDEPPAKQAKTQKLAPSEILEKMKVIQKARAAVAEECLRPGRRGRRPLGSNLPTAVELMSSPNFKLYLYSCKMCSFKCNAVKELQAHRAENHDSRGSSATAGGSKLRNAGGGGVGGGRGAHVTSLQCPRCPFRAATHTLLVKHTKHVHAEGTLVTQKVSLDSKEVAEADVLICGACGFESSNRAVFKRHIERKHGATTE